MVILKYRHRNVLFINYIIHKNKIMQSTICALTPMRFSSKIFTESPQNFCLLRLWCIKCTIITLPFYNMSIHGKNKEQVSFFCGRANLLQMTQLNMKMVLFSLEQRHKKINSLEWITFLNIKNQNELASFF